MSNTKRATNPRGKKISSQLQSRVTGMERSQIEAAASSKPPKTFIIQNVGRGWVSLTDIGIDLAPGATTDLTFWNPNHIQGSTDLRKALKAKLVVQIDREEADMIMEEELAMARLEEAKAKQQSQRRRKIVVDGKEIEAEMTSLNAESGRRQTETISSYGADHDPISYAAAYEIAANDAKAAGQRLSAKEFATLVDRNPGFVKKLLESGGNGSVSGDPGRGRATVRMPEGSGDQVAKMYMGNLDRDGHLPGLEAAGIGTARTSKQRDDLYLDELDNDVDVEDVGQADHIDLSLDDDDAEDAWEEKQRGQVRRRK